MKRRVFLGGAAVAVLPVAAVARPSAISVDAFLNKALPSEKARYHANALAEAMNEMHPGRYVVMLNHDVRLATIYDANGGNAVTHIDDGSPLLADDVTGTTAYADWERSVAKARKTY